MDSNTIYKTVQHIDKQLSKVQLIESNKPAVDHLFELRNTLLLTYKPDPSINWTFKNKRLLNFFKKEVIWTDYKTL